jgi:LysM repeat protein
VSRRQLARYGAPVAFLAGVTIAVLLVRAGSGGRPTSPTTLGPVSQASSAPVPKPEQTVSTARTGTKPAAAPAGAVYYTVQKGDTFGSIATKEGTTIARIQILNPGVSSNALQVGQKIRVR